MGDISCFYEKPQNYCKIFNAENFILFLGVSDCMNYYKAV